mgnify:CR=1 FL=1
MANELTDGKVTDALKQIFASNDAARTKIQAILDDPATADRMLSNPYIGQVPLPEAIDRFYTADVFMHTWDLARAVGGDEIHRCRMRLPAIGALIVKELDQGHVAIGIAQNRLIGVMGQVARIGAGCAGLCRGRADQQQAGPRAQCQTQAQGVASVRGDHGEDPFHIWRLPGAVVPPAICPGAIAGGAICWGGGGNSVPGGTVPRPASCCSSTTTRAPDRTRRSRSIAS